MSVWVKCDVFKVVIDINENFLKMHREGDKWIMQLFIRSGFNKEALLILNRFSVHQQVLLSVLFVGSFKEIFRQEVHYQTDAGGKVVHAKVSQGKATQ